MACYILTESEIRRIAAGRLPVSKALSFRNRAVFAYTGVDVLEYAGQKRAIASDVIDSIAEEAANQANLGDMFADAVSSVVGDLDKYRELDC